MFRKTHRQLVKKALAKPDIKEQYDALEEEFTLLEELIKARIKAEKTQEEIAKAMKTTTSAVGRLETAGGKKRHSPTLATLRKYAKAVGCQLQLKLIPIKN